MQPVPEGGNPPPPLPGGTRSPVRPAGRVVSGGWAISLTIPAQPSMVRPVRAALCAALEGRYSSDCVETARLLLSETVGNAVRHSSGPVVAELQGNSCVLRVSVYDAGAPMPRRSSADFETEGGRGLLLVDTCASRWGVRPCPDGRGKQVWFELEDHACDDLRSCGAEYGLRQDDGRPPPFVPPPLVPPHAAVGHAASAWAS
ncbi:ATP-binding protein [Streptomyces sp. NPDC056632]|uniref:ATP-binding protein n=1 Tax=Streptomyces sp. NPDC056632 TaxID=3345884 RepID=UPI0036CF54AB